MEQSFMMLPSDDIEEVSEDRKVALETVSSLLADQTVRAQVAALRETNDFLAGVDPTGDPDLQKKITEGIEEERLITSPDYLVKVEQLFAEVYGQLGDKHLFRLAEDLVYHQAVEQVSVLNAARLGELLSQTKEGAV